MSGSCDDDCMEKRKDESGAKREGGREQASHSVQLARRGT